MATTLLVTHYIILMMSVNNYQNTLVMEDILLTLLMLSHLRVLACYQGNHWSIVQQMSV